MSVLVIGESLIDIIASQQFPAGGPYNTAIGLSRLGIGTRLLTAIGPDHHGDLLKSHASANGLQLIAQEPTLEHTSTATATIPDNAEAHYSFNFDFRLTDSDTSEALTGNPKIVHYGSLAAFWPPSTHKLTQLIATLKPHAIISIDPNIRPQGPIDTPTLRETWNTHLHLADIVKASRQDLRHLYPETDIAVVPGKIFAAGVQLLVITDGSAGIDLYTPDMHVHVPAPPARVIDTVGAGDTVSAMLLASLHKLTAFDQVNKTWLSELSRETLGIIGQRCAAGATINVTHRGAYLPSLTDMEHIDAIQP